MHLSWWSEVYKTRLIIFLAFAALIIFAWANRFIQDDAFISFRYAYRLAHGEGLTWDPGVRVEGYTSYLWTILLSFALYFGLEPVRFAFLLGLVSFALSLLFTYKLALPLVHSRNAALLTVVLLGSNYTFSSFATSGLETQMHTCLLLGCVLLLFSFDESEGSRLKLLALSVVASASTLTRLDSAVWLSVILPVTLFSSLKKSIGPGQKWASLLCLLLPLTVVVGAWLGWKLYYYGDILPNTYYAKVSGIASPLRGLQYVALFFYSYLLFPFPFLFLYRWRRLFERSSRRLAFLICLIIFWLLYVVSVGGDFMEFRFIVPAMPLLFIAASWLIFTQVKQRALRAVLVSLILLGSVHHRLAFSSPYQIESIRQLQEHVESADENWRGIGQTMGRAFDAKQHVLIATTAAGAIPYYSGLETLDMYGLNDKWVARNGVIVGTRPGHQRLAPFGYLTARGVNILIGQPLLVDSNLAPPFTNLPEAIAYFNIPVSAQDAMPNNSRLIEIPIDSKHKLLVIYLIPHPAVDEAIRKNKWHYLSLDAVEESGRLIPTVCETCHDK